VWSGNRLPPKKKQAPPLSDSGTHPSEATPVKVAPPAIVTWHSDAIVRADTGHAYKVFKQKLPWADAKKRCEEMAGHLVTISSPSEQAFVIECLKKSGVQIDQQGDPAAWAERFWAGGTDENAEGKWRWIDGSDWRFSAWVQNQPDGDGNFLSICPHISAQWNDDPPLTSLTAGFICEWEPKLEGAAVTGNAVQTPAVAARTIAPQIIEPALKWLIDHQTDDGSWSFDLKHCSRCNGQCSHSGSYPDRAGATAMALLACLSHGFTHRDGPYKNEIERGLFYLAGRAIRRDGVLYEEGTHPLFVQGLASLALQQPDY
jgi:hypothetical protein